MLKKAGIVVLGATAGIMSFSGMAFAGEGTSTASDESSNQDKGDDREGGSCDKIAYSEGDRLLSLDNVASNLDISRLNVLGGTDKSLNADGGGCDGDKVAASSGDRLISADNLLANADVERVNALLGSDESLNA